MDVVGLSSGLAKSVVFAVKLSIFCAFVVSMFYTKVFFSVFATERCSAGEKGEWYILLQGEVE